MADPFLRAVELPPDREGRPRLGYPWTLPAIEPLAAYGGRSLHEQSHGELIIATHSPTIPAYPEATIYHCGERGLEVIEYEDADPVRLTRSFLEARDRFLAELLRD